MHATHNVQLKSLRLFSAYSIDPVDPVETASEQAHSPKNFYILLLKLLKREYFTCLIMK